MDKQNKKLIGLFSRYFAVLLLGLGDLYLFYKVLTPLTVRVFYFIVNLFTEANLYGNIVNFGETVVEIVPACVAGAAYYLLFVLVMLTAMNWKTRIKVVGASLVAFFIVNMFRLLVLAGLIGTSNFELVHWIFWHLVSTLFVVGIWFGVVRYFKIKAVPGYTDFMYIRKLSGEGIKGKGK
ncbi:pacearchaeosortase [Candidatus Pacearchaeota archaeon]|nr:pacearchaeosortase [Candidatus Pacearchaeota archaeon]